MTTNTLIIQTQTPISKDIWIQILNEEGKSMNLAFPISKIMKYYNGKKHSSYCLFGPILIALNIGPTRYTKD